MPARLTDKRSGYSLVELLITIFIAGVVFAAMVPLFVGAQERASIDTRLNVCRGVAQDRVEKIRQLDYKEITEANLNDPDFKNRQFGPVYHNLIDENTRSDVYIAYDVELYPVGAADGTEQYKVVTVTTSWDDPNTAAVEPPLPNTPVVLRTEIYKQYAGPQIIAFHLLQDGSAVQTYITAAQVTLKASINSADKGSMQNGNGIVQFSVFNSQGTLIDRRDVTYAQSADGLTYEWVWSTAAAGDGQYNFRAVAYASGFQGNTWQLTYMIEKGAPPAASVTAEPGNGTVSLTWTTTPPPTDLDHYEIWRSSAGEDGPYDQVVASTTSTEYVDMGLTNGTTYWYKVVTVDRTLNSVTSAAVSATPELPPSDTTGPAAPTGLSAANGGQYVPTIIVSWTAHAVDNPPPASPSGLDHYVVQRASNAAFTTGVSTLDASYGTGLMSYTDATAGYSATWYYRLAGVDVAGNQGPWSSVVSATTTAPALRTIRINNGNTAKYYLWVQSKVAPFLWYTQAGASQSTRPTGVYCNKNGSKTWSNMPSGLYTVIWSTASSGTPQTGARDADCSAGNATVSIP